MTDTRSLLATTAVMAADHLEGLATRGAAPTDVALAALQTLPGELADDSLGADQVVEELHRLGAPATMGLPGGRYFGFVNGGTLPAALAADWLVSAWDQNAALSIMSPIAAHAEQISLRWVRELLGLPADGESAFVTGASVANATGLAAARDEVLRRVGWNVGSQGLFGAPPIAVYVGGEAHSTVHKALGLIGMGRDRVLNLPVDAEGTIIPADLPTISGPSIVCLQAGNVNSGGSDPFAPLIEWAHEAGAWVHVDGAFGLWSAASPQLRHLVAGVGEADSWATDGHKWLNVPYDSGIVTVRDGSHLSAALGTQAAYLPGDGREAMHLTPQSSQRARGVVAWAALRHLGRTGVAELVERCCRHAARFGESMTAAGHTVMNDVVINQVVISFGSDETTTKVISNIQADGTIWAGPTVWQGKVAMRFSVSSWATTDDDIDAAVAAVARAVAQAS